MESILAALWRHDGALMAVAMAVCLFGAYTALSLLDRHDDGESRSRPLWLLGAGTAAGSAIWATHFIAMLALDAVMPMTYDPIGTMESIAASIVGATLSLAVACRGGRRDRAVGGAMLGLSIAGMHFLGMRATAMAGAHGHSWGGVCLSLAFGCAAAAAAMVVRRHEDTPRRFAATFLIALSVGAVHMGAMASMRIGPAVGPHVASGGHAVFAVALAGVSGMLLILALAAAIVSGRMEDKDRVSAQRIMSMANLSLEGIVVIDEGGVIVDVNERMRGLAGHDPVGIALATRLPEVCDAIRNGRITSAPIETDLTKADGTRLPVEAFVHKASHVDREAWVVVVRNLTERREAEDRLRYVANHDPLTGLPNRALFMERFGRALGRTARGGEQTALLYIDLDGFKAINDVKGHARGDEVLKHVAAILMENVRSVDTAARIGGDEFVVIQEGDHPGAAETVATRIIDTIALHYGQGRSDVLLGASIGIAISPGDAVDAGELIRLADVALYRAKADGKNQARFFEKSMDLAARDQRQLESDLRSSIHNGELSVVYQPQMKALTGEIVGFEALARWRHPIHGEVSPEVFIEMAERSGFIVEIGAWVLREACATAASWRRPLRIAVNVSAVQMQQQDIAARVINVLASTGLAPDRLEIEITESAILKDEKSTIATLTRLKSLGVKISMDDFGTGYSSLSSLQAFPFDKIKVDRSFVSKIGTDEKAYSIVKAVIALGRTLNLPIVAEGVENERQLDLLRDECCTEIQGYLVGQPLDIAGWRRITEGERPSQAAA